MEMRVHSLPIPQPQAPSAQDMTTSFHPFPLACSQTAFASLQETSAPPGHHLP